MTQQNGGSLKGSSKPLSVWADLSDNDQSEGGPPGITLTYSRWQHNLHKSSAVKTSGLETVETANTEDDAILSREIGSRLERFDCKYVDGLTLSPPLPTEPQPELDITSLISKRKSKRAAAPLTNSVINAEKENNRIVPDDAVIPSTDTASFHVPITRHHPNEVATEKIDNAAADDEGELSHEDLNFLVTTLSQLTHKLAQNGETDGDRYVSEPIRRPSYNQPQQTNVNDDLYCRDSLTAASRLPQLTLPAVNMALPGVNNYMNDDVRGIYGMPLSEWRVLLYQLSIAEPQLLMAYLSTGLGGIFPVSSQINEAAGGSWQIPPTQPPPPPPPPPPSTYPLTVTPPTAIQQEHSIPMARPRLPAAGNKKHMPTMHRPISNRLMNNPNNSNSNCSNSKMPAVERPPPSEGRYKQIARGKSTPEYCRYILATPKDKRLPGVDPVTPRIGGTSWRLFQAEVRAWKRALHRKVEMIEACERRGMSLGSNVSHVGGHLDGSAASSAVSANSYPQPLHCT